MNSWNMDSSKAESKEGVLVREIAIQCVRRIIEADSYANIIVPNILGDSKLDQRDRNLVTEIVYGSTRMQRALDWSIDRFLMKPPPYALRASLRVGAYQIMYTRIPSHAAVNTTVEASSKRNRGVVNAVLRKVADSLPIQWPNEGTRLSYPDWMISLIVKEHGISDGNAMLEVMNLAPKVTERDDGYVQDLASQWVVEQIDVKAGETILDLCAAPGGKATAMATRGAYIVASDIRMSRSSLLTENRLRLQLDNIGQVIADGKQPSFAPSSFDKVLVDAPCSGLGVLHRRADARWRMQPSMIKNLGTLQLELLLNASELVKPNGKLFYSVCTTTSAETLEVAESFTKEGENIVPIPINDDRWRKVGHGGLLLPQDHGTDGMSLFCWKVR
jgi:16S rRNA (cytosine967-C5)-methyltransferase